MSDNSVQGLDTTPIRLPPGVGRADSELRRLTIAAIIAAFAGATLTF